MIRKLFTALSLVAFTLVSCSDNDPIGPDPEVPDPLPEQPIEEEDIPSKLNFSTSQGIYLNLNYNAPKGLVSAFDVYTEYPLDEDGALKTNLIPIAGGVNVAGVSNLKRRIPSYVEEVYVYSPGMFVPRLSHAKIEEGIASFSRVIPDIKTKSSHTRTLGNRRIDTYLKSASDFYLNADADHKYDLIKPDLTKEIPQRVLSEISAAFPEGRKVSDEKFYGDATVEINSNASGFNGAKVYVSIVGAGGIFRNSLSYFVYTGDKEFKDFTQADKEALEVFNIFQCADAYNNTLGNGKDGLTPGKYVQLKYRNEKGKLEDTFPKGAKIGWVLHSDGFTRSDSNFGVNTGARWIYSTPEWNTADSNGNNFTILFSDSRQEYTFFGFEDNPGGDGDCNDVIFHVLTDPAITPAPPVDPVVTHDDTKYGTLSFEDYWPSKGDYDMNDAVLKYHSTITYANVIGENGDSPSVTYVQRIKDVFTLIHSGAVYSNSLSYKVHLSPSLISEVYVTGGGGEPQAYEPVPDGEGFIVDLCRNVNQFVPYNVHGATPYPFTIEMVFKDKALADTPDFQGKVAPYNPFIAQNGDSNIEVHLPMYPPTERADMSYFATLDDHSVIEENVWYIGEEDNNFPFAIHLDGTYKEFKVPVEGQNVADLYPQYTEWVNSGMTTNRDWYLHPRE